MPRLLSATPAFPLVPKLSAVLDGRSGSVLFTDVEGRRGGVGVYVATHRIVRLGAHVLVDVEFPNHQKRVLRGLVTFVHAPWDPDDLPWGVAVTWDAHDEAADDQLALALRGVEPLLLEGMS